MLRMSVCLQWKEVPSMQSRWFKWCLKRRSCKWQTKTKPMEQMSERLHNCGQIKHLDWNRIQLMHHRHRMKRPRRQRMMLSMLLRHMEMCDTNNQYFRGTNVWFINSWSRCVTLSLGTLHLGCAWSVSTFFCHYLTIDITWIVKYQIRVHWPPLYGRLSLWSDSNSLTANAALLFVI